MLHSCLCLQIEWVGVLHGFWLHALEIASFPNVDVRTVRALVACILCAGQLNILCKYGSWLTVELKLPLFVRLDVLNRRGPGPQYTPLTRTGRSPFLQH
jgi:hypothetical protein